MALTLNSRKGFDTLRKLEAAATRRYAEATLLSADEPLGAIYLLGYTVEIRLKCAHYRLENVPPNHDLNAPLLGNSDSPFLLASREIRRLLGAAAPRAVGHHVSGWASLVVSSRANSVLGAFSINFRDDLLEHAKHVSLCWSEILRYRANTPYDRESRAVAEAARWFKRNYGRLWS